MFELFEVEIICWGIVFYFEGQCVECVIVCEWCLCWLIFEDLDVCLFG